MKKQQGFTLIELVVVIVILGILAAVAVPRFVSLQSDARFAVLKGVEASVRSTSAMVHAKALSLGITTGNLPAGSVEGLGPVALVNGYPATAAITSLLELSPSTNFLTPSAGVIQVNGAATPGNCQVAYTQPANAGDAPSIVVTTGAVGGCN